MPDRLRDSNAMSSLADKNNALIRSTDAFKLSSDAPIKDDRDKLNLTDPTIDVGVVEEAASFGDFVWFDGNYFDSNAYGKKRTDPAGREVSVGGAKFDLASEAGIRASRKDKDLTLGSRGISYVKVELLNEDGTPAKVKDVAFDDQQIYTNMNLEVAEGKKEIKAAKGTIGEGDRLKQNFMDGKIYHWYDGWTSDRYEGDAIPDYDSNQKAFKLSADGDQLAYTYTTDLGADYLDNSLYAWTAEKDNRELYGRYFFKGLKPGKYRARFTIYKKDSDFFISPFNKFLDKLNKEQPPVKFTYDNRDKIRPVIKAEEGDITSDAEYNRAYTPEADDEAYAKDAVVTDVFDLGNVRKTYKAFTNKKNPTTADFTLSLTNPSIDAGFVASSDAVKPVSLGNRIWLDTNGNGLQDADELNSDQQIAGDKGFSGTTVELYARSKNDLLKDFAQQVTAKEAGETFRDAIDNYQYIKKTSVNKEGYYRFENLNADTIYRVRFVLPNNLSTEYSFTKQNADQQERSSLTAAKAVLKDVLDKANAQNLLTTKDQNDPAKLETFLVNFFAKDINYLKLVGDGKVTTDENRAKRSAEVDTLSKAFFEKLTPEATADSAKDSDTDAYGYTSSYIVTADERKDDITDGDKQPKPTAPNFDAGLVKSSVSLGNMVWYDEGEGENFGNGQLDSGEKPAEGIKVILYKDGKPAKLAEVLGNGKVTDFAGKEIQADADGQLVTTTDANGKYAFKGLKPGKYQVKFVNEKDKDLVLTEHRDAVRPSKDVSVAANSGENYGLSDEMMVAPVTQAEQVDGLDNPQFDAGYIHAVSLGNRVWFDQNANGQQDPGENFQALKRDQVKVSVTAVKDKAVDEKPFTRTVTVDDQGYYAFKDLIPGDYRLTFTLEGDKKDTYSFTQANAANVDGKLDSDAVPTAEQPASAQTEVVTVRDSIPDDQDNPDKLTNPTVDAGLVAPVSLGNHVWYDEGDGQARDNGRFDQGEKPVADVTVVLYQDNKTPASLASAALHPDKGITDAKGQSITETDGLLKTKTDKNGFYAFKGLKPGRYAVQFVADSLPEGYRFTKQVLKVNTDEVSDPGQDGMTATDEVNFQLDKGTTGLDNPRFDAGIIKPITTPAVSLGNHVWYDEGPGDQTGNGRYDTGEAPVANVKVVLYHDGKIANLTDLAADSEQGVTDLAGQKLDKPETSTNADGFYAFKGLKPGRYAVQFVADSLPEGYRFTKQVLEVNTDEVSDPDQDGMTATDEVNFQLDKGTTGLDNPRFDAGILRKPEQVPGSFNEVHKYYVDIDGEKVPVDENDIINPRTNGQTQAGTKDQTYTTEKYDNPDKPGFELFDVQETKGNPESKADGTTATGNFQPGTDLEVTYKYVLKLVSLGDKTFIDKGEIGKQDEADKPLPGVSVKLMNKDGQTPSQYVKENGLAKLKAVQDTSTNADGYYSFKNLLPDTYKLQFTLTPEQADKYQFTIKNKDGVGNQLDSDANEQGITDPQAVTLVDKKPQGQKLDNPNFDAGVVEKQPEQVPGSFNEVHKYYVDIDGEKVPVDENDIINPRTNGQTQAGTKDQTYTTEKYDNPDKPGFELFDVQETKGNPESKADGTTATGNFQPGTDLEVTYKYVLKLVSLGDKTFIDKGEIGKQDEADKPLPGVSVKLMNKDGQTPSQYVKENGLAKLKAVQDTSTNADGYYSFKNLLPDTYKLQFTLTPEQADKYQFTIKNKDGVGNQLDSDANEQGITDPQAVTLVDKKPQGQKLDNPNFDAGVIEKDTEEANPPQAVLGYFKDHNYYYVVDHKGNRYEIPDLAYHTEQQAGSAEQTYTTEGKQRDHYNFVRTENPVNNPQYASDGSKQVGNFEPNVTKEITYIFERPVVSLGDFVFIDVDKDGLQSATDKPLAGVKVTVLTEDNQNPTVFNPTSKTFETKEYTTTTDASGHYHFDYLVEGRYKVLFSLTKEQAAIYQFTKQGVGQNDALDSDADAYGETAAKEVTAAQLVDGLNNPFFDAGVIEKDTEEANPPSQKTKRVIRKKSKGSLPETGQAYLSPFIGVVIVLLALGLVYLSLSKQDEH